MTAKKGMFASPDYPNVYPANITCLWIIRVPDAEGILVQFMKLVAIGRTSVCRDDYLVSYEDGKYSSKSEPVIECGDKVEDKYFTGNEVWIEFKSGTTNRGFGFQAVYDAWFDSAITSQGKVKVANYISNYEFLPSQVTVPGINGSAHQIIIIIKKGFFRLIRETLHLDGKVVSSDFLDRNVGPSPLRHLNQY